LRVERITWASRGGTGDSTGDGALVAGVAHTVVHLVASIYRGHLKQSSIYEKKRRPSTGRKAAWAMARW